MTSPDAGLRAVRRVREVRERDAVVILHEAGAARDAAAHRVADVRAALADVPVPVPGEQGPAATLVARAACVVGGAEVLARLVRDADAAELEVLGALDQWTVARSRLRAIELLEERRVAARRAALARREQRDSDDLAGSRPEGERS
jgi:flagellar export protein FliJ